MSSSALDAEITAQPWPQHLDGLRWAQGDHALIAAPTNAGKTTLARHLLRKRSHAVVMVTKLHDPTISTDYQDYERITAWPPKPWQRKVLLWPKPKKTLNDTVKHQREIFGQAFNDITLGDSTGWSGWGVFVDESHYMTVQNLLRLGIEIGMMHHVGRSAGISMLTATQRPAWIPKIIYSSVTHAYIARTRDPMDLKRLSDLANIDPKHVARTVSGLADRHDYVYLNPQGDASPRIVNTRR